MDFMVLIAIDQKNGISKEGAIPWKNANDRTLYSFLTRFCAKGRQNWLIVGRKTFMAMEQYLSRNIHQRYIIVSQTNGFVQNYSGPAKALIAGQVSSFSAALALAKTAETAIDKLFVMGGKAIYEEAIQSPFCREIYISHIPGDYGCDNVPDLSGLNNNYIEEGQFTLNSLEVTKLRQYNISEHNYLGLLKSLLNRPGHQNRTQVATKKLPGKFLEYDLSNNRLPLMTTKYVNYEHIILELIWMLQGRTDSKWLEDRGVNIWRQNASKDFLAQRGLNYSEGELGPIYGFQWRNFGGQYIEGNTGKIAPVRDGVDQIQRIVHQLINDPFSRRIVLMAWNPAQIDKMALPPCHMSVTFNVEETPENGHKKLHALVNMRSNDMFLGHPYNCAFYATLVHLLAGLTGLFPGKLSFAISDCHIYTNQIEAIKEQLAGRPRIFPRLKIDIDKILPAKLGNSEGGFSGKNRGNDVVSYIGQIIDNLSPEHFHVIGYQPGPRITAKMVA